MCSIPWNKTIRVQKCSELKKTGLQAAKAKRKISTTWAVSLEPQFVQANMDDARGICIFKIRNAIPEGIVVASAAYIAAYGWLCIIDENQRLDRERMAGLSYWYMIHYLHCMDYERYGSHYDQIIERLIPKAGVMLYRELKEKRHNLSNQVFSILQDLILVQQQEGNRLTTVRQTEDKTASDTHNAGSG